jgi:hypothetical protein
MLLRIYSLFTQANSSSLCLSLILDRVRSQLNSANVTFKTV